MASELREFFDDRKQEIEKFFDFLNNLNIDINTNINLKFISSDGEEKETQLENEQIKIFKSNCFLLLYNAIEGTINKSIEYLIDEVNASNKKNSQVKKEIKAIWYKHCLDNEKIQQTNNSKIAEYIDEFVNTQIDIELREFREKNASYFSSGNLDAQKIREELLPKIGINYLKNDIRFKVEKLKDIKIIRNDLAHGSKSFVEISESKTLGEIKVYKDDVFGFLDNYVIEFEKYVNEQQFIE